MGRRDDEVIERARRAGYMPPERDRHSTSWEPGERCRFIGHPAVQTRSTTGHLPALRATGTVLGMLPSGHVVVEWDEDPGGKVGVLPSRLEAE